MAAAVPKATYAAAALRATLAVAGGYALVHWAVVVAAALLAAAGLARSEAVVSAALCGLCAYWAWLLWALACTRLARLGAALAAGGCLLALLQWSLPRAVAP